MSNVVHFSGAQDKRRGHNQQKPEIKKAIFLKDALKAGVNFGWADQQRVARRFDKLLKELKKEKAISPAAVAREVGLGGNNSTDSSKRLYTYRLPENASDKRKAEVAKKPDKYFEFAKAVANLSGASEEKILAQLFESCSFGSVAPPVPDWDTERWEKLAELIEAMSAAVVFDTSLETYYRDLRETPIRYNVDDDSFDTGPYESDTYGIELGLVGNPIYRGEAPPVPSVRIATKPIAGSFADEVETENGENFAMTFDVYLDVHLALGPLGGGKNIGPLLEFRSRFVGHIDNDPAIRVTIENPFHDGADQSPTLVLDDEIVQLVKFPSFQMVCDTAEYRADTDHAYFNWYDVSPAVLREVLSLSTTGIEVSPSAWSNLDQLDEIPSRFAQFSAADSVYRALMDGRLEAALSEQCTAIAHGLWSYRQTLREQIQLAESVARENWRRPAAHNISNNNSEE